MAMGKRSISFIHRTGFSSFVCFLWIFVTNRQNRQKQYPVMAVCICSIMCCIAVVLLAQWHSSEACKTDGGPMFFFSHSDLHVILVTENFLSLGGIQSVWQASKKHSKLSNCSWRVDTSVILNFMECLKFPWQIKMKVDRMLPTSSLTIFYASILTQITATE